MTDDDLLNLIGLRAEHFRKQDDRAPKSERDGLPAGDVANLSPGANEFLCLVVDGQRRHDRARLPQSSKPPESEADTTQAKRNAGKEDHGNENGPIEPRRLDGYRLATGGQSRGWRERDGRAVFDSHDHGPANLQPWQ
jgi:hypothetical protein